MSFWKNAVGAVVNAVGNLVGGNADRKAQLDINRQNAELQREFAQNGIRWRVADAEAAGLHPLAALGATGAAASPSYQINGSEGDTFRQMGQDFSRAIDATSTRKERALRLENMELQNDLLRADIRGRSTQNPPMPIDLNSFMPSQGDVPLGAPRMVNTPVKVTPGQKDRPGEEAGQHPYTTYFRTDTGLKPRIPNSSAEALESDYVGVLEWNLDNKLMPNVSWAMDKLGKRHTLGKPSYSRLPRGADDWVWSPLGREWHPVKRTGRFGYKRMLMDGRSYGER